MKINIRFDYTSDIGSKMMKQASFQVNEYKFKLEPDQEAARVAFEWWKQIKHEMSYRAILESIIYNGDNDITKLVQQLDDAPLPDLDLPF